MNLFQNLKRSQSGSAVTGFAFIFPLVIVLTLLVVQFIFIAINYASISLAVENSTRLARIGYSDNQILIQTNNNLNNYSLISNEPSVVIQNINFKNKNLKVFKIEIIYNLFGFNAFKIVSKSYAF